MILFIKKEVIFRILILKVTLNWHRSTPKQIIYYVWIDSFELVTCERTQISLNTKLLTGHPCTIFTYPDPIPSIQRTHRNNNNNSNNQKNFKEEFRALPPVTLAACSNSVVHEQWQVSLELMLNNTIICIYGTIQLIYAHIHIRIHKRSCRFIAVYTKPTHAYKYAAKIRGSLCGVCIQAIRVWCDFVSSSLAAAIHAYDTNQQWQSHDRPQLTPISCCASCTS